MSASLDVLEDLDNKTLRAKCMEFGLPNIPITDTSRKLLIKRLRIAMEGGDKQAVKEKPKSRRETIHVVKVDTESTKVRATLTPTKSKVTSSRQTIGPAILTKDEVPPARETITQRRRSGRTTPISQLDRVVSQSSKRKVDDVIQEYDEDEIPIPVIIERSKEHSKQTRAPSLSKSVVVTTSYVKDSPKDIIEIDESDPDEYEEEEPEIEQEIEPVKYKYISSARAYDTSKPFVPSLERDPVLSYSSDHITQPVSRISLSKAQTSTLPYESSAGRRYTTGYKNLPEVNENRTFAHHADHAINNEEDDQLESPFLSDFARRLSRLKPEPLPSAVQTPIKSEVVYREAPRRYFQTAVSSRRGISNKDSISDSFNKFVVALDRKYNLKRNFIIFAIVLAIILIYVLFF